MNISGIIVVVPPHCVAQSIKRLQAMDGVEVHYHDAATGRIVVTQESLPSADPEAALNRLQSHPDVLRVELVYHCAEGAREICHER